MNTLEQIKAGFAMGWSAILDYGEGSGHVVGIKQNGEVICLWNADYAEIESGFEKMEIVSYLYAGELAGNEPIPEGQKFRVKEYKENNIFFMPSAEEREGTIMLRRVGETDGLECFDKSEIEPVFETPQQ